jgi:hypothetical protein
MQSYYIRYRIRGRDQEHTADVEARDIKSAKRKIGKKHGYKDGRMIHLIKVDIIGYF